jgi:hypothetical protein
MIDIFVLREKKIRIINKLKKKFKYITFENPSIMARNTICLMYSRVNLEILEDLGS